MTDNFNTSREEDHESLSLGVNMIRVNYNVVWLLPSISLKIFSLRLTFYLHAENFVTYPDAARKLSVDSFRLGTFFMNARLCAISDEVIETTTCSIRVKRREFMQTSLFYISRWIFHLPFLFHLSNFPFSCSHINLLAITTTLSCESRRRRECIRNWLFDVYTNCDGCEKNCSSSIIVPPTK